jgi:hypothetical protein
MPLTTPITDLSQIPLVCYEKDLADILGTSERQIRRLRQHGGPLPREAPRVDRKHRWYRGEVIAFLENQKPRAPRR